MALSWAAFVTAGVCHAAFVTPVQFRGHGHVPIGPGTLSLQAGATGDTLVVSQPAGTFGGIRTFAGPSLSWSVAFQASTSGVGDSIDIGGTAIVSGGDPDIKMLTASREANEKLRLTFQGVVKARRKQEGSDT
jgi:hypothetical protein